MKTIPPRTQAPVSEPPKKRRWQMRLALLAVIAFAVGVVYFTNIWLTNRFTEATRDVAERRLSLYRGNIISQLQRNSVVPLLLSQDPTLIRALRTEDYLASSKRLISFRDEIGSADLLLLDKAGKVVAATDRSVLGATLRQAPYFIDALRSPDTVFSAYRDEEAVQSFTYARSIRAQGETIGVIVAAVDLQQFERSWRTFSDAVIVTDSTGMIILATEPLWRGRTVEDALATQSELSAIEQALNLSADWTFPPADAYVAGQAVLRSEERIPFQGWRITSFTAYSSVRERVNSFLALEIMVFAILLAVAFGAVTRRAQTQSRLARAESEELRALNVALQREIAEREKAEKNLEVAEQTVAQTSKLAALGEMSAAVSHELNQPLAAMKTYLAGAKLLLQRRRGEEALSSFQRIDDLIERMGAITRQLKSYARRGEEAFEPVDFRDAVSAALTMMEPQLKRREVAVIRSLPLTPVLVEVDRLRLEQVLINLFRNALDATRKVTHPKVELILSEGDTATLTVRDNGHGIDDLDSLFEPFYTTKAPGDGVGLGLAISSSIVGDLGGRLTARNGREGGAVFELQLPLVGKNTVEAAE